MNTGSAVECSQALLSSVRAHGLFVGLSEDEWLRVCRTIRTVFLRHDDQICAKGDPADSLFVIWDGEVSITDGTHIVTRRRGEVVGEQALIEGIGRGATMTACGNVQLIVVPRSTFDSLVGPHSFARSVLKIVSAKLNEATNQRAKRFAREERLFGEFRAHVSPAVLNALLSEESDYGRPRLIDGVVLLSDIRNFTARSSQLEPVDVAEQVGAYLNHAVTVIHQHEGLVDKFVGDAILAVWGWPVDRADGDIANAFRCANALAESAGQFSFGGAPIEIGVGLNAGAMFIGNVGSGAKRQFTVLGEVVNLAARFESMTKDLGASIVVSQTVHDRLQAKDRTLLTPYRDQQPRGGERQTVYGVRPVGRTSVPRG